jgi:anti-anti-sigma regulatory factor
VPFKIVHPPSSAVAAAKNCEAILNRVRVEPKPPKLVVLDLSAAPIIDMQSAHMLAGMVDPEN